MKHNKTYWLSNALCAKATDARITDYKNGNGIYWMGGRTLQRVHSNGFMTDNIIVYDNLKYASDSGYFTATDKKNMQSLINKYHSKMIGVQ